MSKNKIFNDPVYGFTAVPYGILFDLIEHPYFQRLRRIKQVGLTHYVYPGCLHTRFHHALGALHLMREAIEVLRSKNIEITEEEAEATCIAILLHDIGHGPFSHGLENILIQVHHEDISKLFMEELNEQFDGKLSMAIRIFKGEYEKPFLHQLISGQLDMDRLDYLNRDSFFTGVSEGVIGYDRIIKMLDVRNGKLVVEEKGIYSIEKFLIARRLMYWQVYLHKTVLAAEQMLIRVVLRFKELYQQGKQLNLSPALRYFFENNIQTRDFEGNRKKILDEFALLDDVDIAAALKNNLDNEDFILSFLSQSLVNRKLFKIELKNQPFEGDYIEKMRQKLTKEKGDLGNDWKHLIFWGKESNSEYSTLKDEIHILFKNGQVLPMSEASDRELHSKIITKYYLCYPKIIC